MNIPLTPIRFLRYAEQQHSSRTAVVCGESRFNYKEFADRSARLGGALRAAGVEPGDRVAFLSLNCHRLLEAYYGVLEAEAVLLPLNVRLNPNELAFILNDAGAKVLFVGAEFVDVAESFRKDASTVESYFLMEGKPQRSWLRSENYDELLSRAEPCCLDFMNVDEDSLAEIFYTSGTSANPKGVMLTHRNIYLHALAACVTLHPTPESVELHTIPLFHANGWGVAHSLVYVGAKHVMMRRFETAEVFRLIEREGATDCALVPTMATALVNCPERPKHNLSSLRRITIGGAASSPTLIREVEEKIGCLCFSGYGLTETSPTLTISPLRPGAQIEGEERYRVQAMTGRPVYGVELRVVDCEDRDVPHDGKTIGEIVARGDGVMKGYWQQPEATAEVMRGGWFHTGDMATINEDGYLLVVDRKKDIIVSGGENISSLEVEKALVAHPAVYEVAVVPVPDAKWGEVPKALVVLKHEANLTEEELLNFCRTKIAHYKAPRSVEFLPSLPKTGTGKILKRDLRAKYWAGHTGIRPELASKK